MNKIFSSMGLNCTNRHNDTLVVQKKSSGIIKKSTWLLPFLLITSFPALSSENNTPFLITKSFTIFVDEKCPEGELSCDNVIYHAINRKTHAEITLKGHVINIKPSMDFAGYLFTNGDYQYQLTPSHSVKPDEADMWTLSVWQKRKMLLEENGFPPKNQK